MRYYGKVGYVKTVDKGDGVWEEVIEERWYYGDVTRNTYSLDSTSYLNDNFTISNSFSLVADDYAYSNFNYIRYIEFLGVKWNVTSVDALNRPRLVLQVKGVYNETEESS